MEEIYYKKNSLEILRLLGTSHEGLNEKESLARLLKYGENKLPEGKKDTFLKIFFNQFKSPLVYILLLAAVAIFFIGEIIDSGIIFFVLIFNATMGSIQEGRAQQTFLALKNFSETKALVIRNGKEIIIPDTKLVPGDIIILQEGEKVPADARLIENHNLKTNESSLTGESLPVDKISEIIKKENLPIAEQKNIVFKGTQIVAGNARAVVIKTGLETFIGKISQKIINIDTEIPLKKNIRHLAKLILIIIAILIVIFFSLGFCLGKPLKEIVGVSISLAVSIIPEGLPIVLTLVLATGVWRMSKKQALVKKLQAVETLGQTKIIAVDKTGTITKNEISVQKIFANNNIFEVTGNGYEPKGIFVLNNNIIEILNHPELILIGKIAAFCSNARTSFDENKKIWNVIGDPTEAALSVLSQKIGFNKNDLEKENPLVFEIPFNYQEKFHATENSLGKKNLISVVGAPEVILAKCNQIWLEGKNKRLNKNDLENLEKTYLKMSREGLRVLAIAYKQKNVDNENETEIKQLNFLGFCGMKDPLRFGVRESIKETKEAGIKVIMMTGDHKITAETIAREAGIIENKDDLILEGKEIEKMTDEELKKEIQKIKVFARVTPEIKLRIIEIYKELGFIIAMTGDGVNDAPSLVAADLGIAMGKIGTEVAKEASEIVLLDDNFNTIVGAIEEGRNILKTIKKVILYLFSTSLAEILFMLLTIILGYPIPLLAAQIIWLNLITDSFLDISLAMEVKEKNLLKKPFKKPGKYILNYFDLRRIIFMAIPMTLGSIFLFQKYLPNDWLSGGDLTKTMTVALTALAVFQWFNAWNCRSESKSIFNSNFLKNKFLLGATGLVITLQILAVYNPFMQKILHTTSLSLNDWLLIILVASSIIWLEELRKLLFSKKYFVFKH